jgi:AraC family transcriptional regulator of adaptative response/methylated-DNA-[protein]-cysteine methyltransferase
VQRACAYIDAHLDSTLPLAIIARAAHGSPSHVQRTFKRVLGISPRAYVDAKRQERLRRALRSGQPIGRAVYEAGYGSSRPVYEAESAPLGMTPATYRTGGTGHTIRFTVVDSPVGNLLVAATDRGLCSVRLGGRKEALEAELRSEFPAAHVTREPGPPRGWVEAIQQSLSGETPALDLPLDVQATAFQRRVWEALRRIPAGQTRSYAQVARAVGAPRAARAVARACATNPVALVVPCHRVVRAGGELAGYRWGIQRKRMLLDREQDAAQASGAGRRAVRAVR